MQKWVCQQTASVRHMARQARRNKRPRFPRMLEEPDRGLAMHLLPPAAQERPGLQAPGAGRRRTGQVDHAARAAHRRAPLRRREELGARERQLAPRRGHVAGQHARGVALRCQLCHQPGAHQAGRACERRAGEFLSAWLPLVAAGTANHACSERSSLRHCSGGLHICAACMCGSIAATSSPLLHADTHKRGTCYGHSQLLVRRCLAGRSSSARDTVLLRPRGSDGPAASAGRCA